MVKSVLRITGFPLAWISVLVMFVLVSACETEPTSHWASSGYDAGVAFIPVGSGSDAGSDDEQDAGTSGAFTAASKCQGEEFAFYLDGDTDESGGGVGGVDFDLMYPGILALDQDNPRYTAEVLGDGVKIYPSSQNGSNFGTQFWSVTFRTRVPSEQLQPGIYDVQDTREPEGPLLDVDGNSSNYPAQIDDCGYVCGSFQVHEIRISGSTLERFRASFIQNCRCAPAELRGCIAFTG